MENSDAFISSIASLLFNGDKTRAGKLVNILSKVFIKNGGDEGDIVEQVTTNITNISQITVDIDTVNNSVNDNSVNISNNSQTINNNFGILNSYERRETAILTHEGVQVEPIDVTWVVFRSQPWLTSNDNITFTLQPGTYIVHSTIDVAITGATNNDDFTFFLKVNTDNSDIPSESDVRPSIRYHNRYHSDAIVSAAENKAGGGIFFSSTAMTFKFRLIIGGDITDLADISVGQIMCVVERLIN